MATLPSATSALTTEVANCAAKGKKVFVVEREFDLNELLDAVIANGDVINLLKIPKNHTIFATALEVLTIGTDDATTFTLQLRFGSTAIGAALSAVAEGLAIGGATTYALPITVGTSDTYLNLVAVVSGGNAVVTKNPKVRVQVVLCDMG